MTSRGGSCTSSDRGTQTERALHRRRGVEPDDLVRLNSLLNADIRFEVDSGAGSGAGTASGVLVCESSTGRRRTATYPIMFSRKRRKLLNSLSRSLAECAMALGLGAGVYSERARSGEGRSCRARSRHL